MDTPAVGPSKPDTSTVGRIVDQVVSGRDAVLVGPSDRAFLLYDVVQGLEDRNCSVFHVTAAEPDGLGLSSLLAQVAGDPDSDSQEDDILDRAFQRLTVRGPGCDRIVLFIDGADTLHDAVFRYLALVCRASDELQVVLVGPTDPTTRIGEAAGFLRARLTAQPAFQVGADAASYPDFSRSTAILPDHLVDDTLGMRGAPTSPMGRTSHAQRTVWIIAGLGVAAAAVIGFGMGWQVRSAYREGTLPSAASPHADPATSPNHVRAAPITPAPDPGHPVTGVEAAPPPRPSPTALVPAPQRAAEHGSGPSSTAEAVGQSNPAPVEPPSPSAAATVSKPTARAIPVEPEQTPAPPASAPSSVPSATKSPTPAPPAAMPEPRSAGQDGGSPATSSPPRVRSAVPGAPRARPPADTAEHRSHDQSRRRSEAVVQESQPRDLGPRSSQPVIGSFVVGPDGTRVFRPNP